MRRRHWRSAEAKAVAESVWFIWRLRREGGDCNFFCTPRKDVSGGVAANGFASVGLPPHVTWLRGVLKHGTCRGFSLGYSVRCPPLRRCLRHLPSWGPSVGGRTET